MGRYGKRLREMRRNRDGDREGEVNVVIVFKTIRFTCVEYRSLEALAVALVCLH